MPKFAFWSVISCSYCPSSSFVLNFGFWWRCVLEITAVFRLNFYWNIHFVTFATRDFSRHFNHSLKSWQNGVRRFLMVAAFQPTEGVACWCLSALVLDTPQLDSMPAQHRCQRQKDSQAGFSGDFQLRPQNKSQTNHNSERCFTVSFIFTRGTTIKSGNFKPEGKDDHM